ncbi:polysaccharide deacetylase family protein [Brevibacillus sp. B_LB10_24]|uniref:polysaccharide deacetylase family protein n=1 Tax=Brevibacillus sp. B_LB10_24 TaxID=3380645 RepID=UPI0038BBCAE7
MEKVLWISLFLLCAYCLIPGVMSLVFGFGVFRKARARREVAFTFDDGPDPDYTPQLLDLLGKYKIKATFFVLGSKAEKHAELIHRIHREGHLIGIHNYVHQPNWLLAPWKVRRQINRSVEIVERITGERPIYYRPPWGLLTLLDFRLRRQFRMVLWSTMARDWKSKGSLAVKKRLLKRIRGGAVILLHDSGTTWGADRDAPQYTIEALEEVFQEISLQDNQCVRVDEMMQLHEQGRETQVHMGKRLLLFAWMKWEKAFHLVFRVKPIDVQNRFLHVRVRVYRGETIRLSDGEEIRRGDRIVELHFDNGLLYAMATGSQSPVQLAIKMIRATEQVMPKILYYILQHPSFPDIKGVYGVSLIHRGAKKFGFTLGELPKGILSFFTRMYLRMLLLVLHPSGKQRLQTNARQLIPKTIAMSTKELLRRYSREIENPSGVEQDCSLSPSS